MPEACSNGVRIRYDDRGEGRPALLFLPGWCVSRQVFADLPMFEVPQQMSAEIERFIAPPQRPSLDAARAPADSWVNALPL